MPGGGEKKIIVNSVKLVLNANCAQKGRDLKKQIPKTTTPSLGRVNDRKEKERT